MVGSDENHPGVIRPLHSQGVLHDGMGHNRRVLGTINQNTMRAAPHPCAVNKKGPLAENYGLSNRIAPPVPTNRPITRFITDPSLAISKKFAAQIAGKQQQPLPEETKKLAPPVQIPIESEDVTIIDVDEYKAASDSPVPMFVQHTEAMLDEIDRMDEDEMEDIPEKPVSDIDSADKKNPLAVVEYIDDLYAYYKRVESSSCVSPNYMAQQSDLNEKMRGILIDWLIEVHYKFELMDETLYLTVNLIDRFLAVQPVVRKKLQLVGVTAMLLACKYEEVSVPVVEDLILISDKAYSRIEVLQMVGFAANTLSILLNSSHFLITAF
ncbi:hypothetical protein RHGRI_022181 [Rhododendron griersonianum]|uniref:Cyclin-like domain-containing protein n=1 Tax=Rhododendron griersonianum TaxID=479676 RepID=A0AAV6JN44_9ERIC|nr:hypothetical protein RHGRI_022181 [Rhododendron griersonianum]